MVAMTLAEPNSHKYQNMWKLYHNYIDLEGEILQIPYGTMTAYLF